VGYKQSPFLLSFLFLSNYFIRGIEREKKE